MKEIARLTKLLNKKDRNLVTVFDRENDTNETTEVGEETLKKLLDTHFAKATEVPHRKYTSEVAITREQINNSFRDWINADVIKEALESFNSKKSPGPDGLKPIIFKYLDERMIKYLEFIYKSCICLLYTSPSPRDS